MSKHNIGFALCGTGMTFIFLGIVNYLTSPNYIWFLYPAAALVLWPITFLIISSREHKSHALIGSISLLIILGTLNYFYSNHPWTLYSLFPIACWPITVYSGRRVKTLTFAIVITSAAIVYYTMLNTTISPQFPWAIFPSYLLLWWPLTLYFVRRKQFISHAVAGSLLTIAFFITVNAISTPHTIWAIYPTFVVLWWPLTLYFVRRKQIISHAVAGSLLAIAFFIIVNAISTPHTVWAIYPAFVVLWWPLTLYFYFERKKI